MPRKKSKYYQHSLDMNPVRARFIYEPDDLLGTPVIIRDNGLYPRRLGRIQRFSTDNKNVLITCGMYEWWESIKNVKPITTGYLRNLHASLGHIPDNNFGKFYDRVKMFAMLKK